MIKVNLLPVRNRQLKPKPRRPQSVYRPTRRLTLRLNNPLPWMTLLVMGVGLAMLGVAYLSSLGVFGHKTPKEQLSEVVSQQSEYKLVEKNLGKVAGMTPSTKVGGYSVIETDITLITVQDMTVPYIPKRKRVSLYTKEDERGVKYFIKIDGMDKYIRCTGGVEHVVAEEEK